MPLTIERNDLAAVTDADAIVIAANEHLRITGGVGMTVAQAAGLEKLQAACDEIGFCSCGSAVATPAFALNARVIVHAVGPVWQGGNLGEADFLRSAYDAALDCAAREGARSIALPLISAGTYGFPADVSLSVARESIRAFLNRHDDINVRLVLYSRDSVAAGMAAYLDIAEYIDDTYVDGYPEWRSMAFNAPAASAPCAATASDAAQGHGSRKREGLISRLGEAVGSARARREEKRAAEIEAELSPSAMAAASGSAGSLECILESLDAPFSSTLLSLIDERGMTDAQVYKRANMSRQLFSKIRSNADYRPTKKTVLALAVALGLNLDETNDLLARAGFALSHSNKADVIVEYFIGHGNHDIFEINEALYAFDQPLL